MLEITFSQKTNYLKSNQFFSFELYSKSIQFMLKLGKHIHKDSTYYFDIKMSNEGHYYIICGRIRTLQKLLQTLSRVGVVFAVSQYYQTLYINKSK